MPPQVATQYDRNATHAVCMVAARRGVELQRMVRDLRALCGRAGLDIGKARCQEVENDLTSLIASANEAHGACAKRREDPDAPSCVASLCPMAAADVAISGLGVSIAILKLQASAVHLRKVS
jgi:hypothetical protein